MFRAVTDGSTLQEVASSLSRRYEEQVRRADEADDKAALEWWLTSLELVEEMRRDLRRRPWAVREVAGYLRRAARLHAEDPQHQPASR